MFGIKYVYSYVVYVFIVYVFVVYVFVVYVLFHYVVYAGNTEQTPCLNITITIISNICISYVLGVVMEMSIKNLRLAGS